MTNDIKDISLSPLRITIIYLVVAGLWIAFTDQILNELVTDPQYLSVLQTYKGWFYVLVTGLGLFYLIKKYETQISSQERELEETIHELKSEQELVDKLFESIPVMLTIYDPELEAFDANNEFKKITGWTTEKLQEIDLLKELYPDHDLRQEAVQFMNQPGIGWREFNIQTKSGETVPTSWTNIKLTDDTSVGIGIDMSEIKATEAKIRESRELLRKTIDSLQESVILLDPNSRTIIECNERTEEMFGYSYDELIGSLTKKLHVDEKHFEQFATMSDPVLTEKGIFQTEFEMKRKDGTTLYTDHTVSIVYNEDGSMDKVVSVVRDITQQKEYRKQLEERNLFIERTIDNLPIGVAVNKIDEGTATLMNKKFTEIYGWPKEVLKNVESFLQKVYPDDEYRAEIQNQIKKDIETGNPEKMQWSGVTITTKEGDEKIINAKNIPLYDQNLMISTVIDVTARKKAEKELAREKQRFQLVAETTSDVIWDLDITTNELWWSEGFEETFGHEQKSPKENFEKWSDYVHPDDREMISASSDQAIESGAREWTEEYRLIKADGSVAHMIDRAVIIRNQDGQAVRMIGTMDDITERKLAEKKLRESEEKYRHLFENNPEPMWIYNPKTLKFVEVNQAAVDHYGYTEEEFLNMTLLDIRPGEDTEALKKDVRQNKGDISYSEEWTHIKKDGTHIEVETSAADVQHRGVHHRLVLINDVTEQKRVQEKIIQSVIEGEDRERKRIAHELHDGLGQYLVAASMNLQSAKTDADQLPEKRQSQLETGLSLLKNALSETRSIAHNLMPKTISDYGLITALKNLVKDLKKSNDIAFKLDHNCDDLDLNNQSEINIYRIVQEITSNAIRHSECTALTIQLQVDQDTLTLIVEDNGIGVELSEQDEEKGLGLRSIKSRVNNLKGALDIQSEQGKGMKITITIPDIQNLKSNGASDGEN